MFQVRGVAAPLLRSALHTYEMAAAKTYIHVKKHVSA